MNKILALIFNVSITTIYKKREKDYIFLLIEKYFNEAELLEFLDKKEIKKQELVKHFSLEELEKYLPKIDRTIEINFFKKIDKLKKFEQRLIFSMIKYYQIDLKRNWIENLDFFEKQYRKEFKILNSVKDNIILLPHHFKSCKKSFNVIFERDDFIFIVENKEKIIKKLQKNLKKIF